MKKNKKIYIFLTLLPVIAVMSVIFYFSSQTAEASTVTSGGFVEKAMEYITRLFGEISEDTYAGVEHVVTIIVRKLAHFLEFAALGFFAELHLRTWLSKKTWLFSTVFSVLYACSDELHQNFVSERAMRFTDVCVDTSGAVCGILSVFIIFMIAKCVNKKRGEKKQNAEA